MKLGAFWRNLGDAAVYYPGLAKVTGGVTASVLFCYLFNSSNPDDWVSLSCQEIENATGLNRSEQELARRQLVERALLQEELLDDDSETRSFLPDVDALEKRLAAGEQASSFSPKDSESAPETNDTTVGRGDPVGRRSRGVKTDKFFPVRRQPISVKVTPNYQFEGPWESQEQFEAFQKALFDYAKKQGMNYPSGWVFKIIDGITKGIISPFWEEFISGISLGESQKHQQEWEIEPGVPYPALEEERTQYHLNKGEPIEAALSKARRDLRDPVLGKDLWEGFLRKCDRVADEAIKAKNSGVATPYLPPSFTDKPQITKQSVMEKLSSVAPQSSRLTSSSDAQEEVEAESQQPEKEPPSLSALQEAYKTPMGQTLVEKQIAEHPEWGYQIVDGQVVDKFPF